VCELRSAEGKVCMFLAIDRVSKFAYVELHDRAKMLNATAFLRNVIQAFPYQIHTVLTDNGMAFADLPKNRTGVTRTWLGPHMVDRLCREHGITHKLTRPYQPWTTDEVEQPLSAPIVLFCCRPRATA
jgi:Integrase core domain